MACESCLLMSPDPDGSVRWSRLPRKGPWTKGQSSPTTKLDALTIGTPSEPVAAQDGIRVFFVCGRRQPDIRPPDFDTVFGQMQEKRLTMMARRYLRDLRRDSIVDYR